MQIGIREEKTNALASNFDEEKRRDMLGRTPRFNLGPIPIMIGVSDNNPITRDVPKGSSRIDQPLLAISPRVIPHHPNDFCLLKKDGR